VRNSIEACRDPVAPGGVGRVQPTRYGVTRNGLASRLRTEWRATEDLARHPVRVDLCVHVDVGGEKVGTDSRLCKCVRRVDLDCAAAKGQERPNKKPMITVQKQVSVRSETY